jgi:copper transport protein
MAQAQAILSRRFAAAALLAALLSGLAAPSAFGHAALVGAQPEIGADISPSAPPAEVRLSFSEQPEASLSEIQVLLPGGTAEQIGRPGPVPGDPLSLRVPVRSLPPSVYTVSWKVVSAVDGHVTGGTYAFGVGASPQSLGVTTSRSTSSTSALELVARWLFLAGIVVLLGSAIASVARFGGPSGGELRLAAAAWLVSAAGLLLLADAQRSTAGASLGELLGTSVGRALTWRAVGLLAAGAGLLVARQAPRWRRGALAATALAALGVIVAHVAAGHAAAASWPSAVSIAVQAAHFAAAGVWFGGLAALLLGIRGEPSGAKAAAIRRFGAAALVALVVVLLTGILRTVDVLSSWGELITSGYGRAITAKIVLVALIAALAAVNRWRNVPRATADLSTLRRFGGGELALALVALALAALLGTSAPPVAGRAAGPATFSVSGADFGTTTRVNLTTSSRSAGPNRFTVGVEDYDSGEQLRADEVSLRFTSLDDASISSSSLKLRARPDGSFAGSGANLAFDGRWRVDVLVERGAQAVEIPLQLTLPGLRQPVSVSHVPGRPPQYTIKSGPVGKMRIELAPKRPGASRAYVTCLTPRGQLSQVEQLVLTSAVDGGPARQVPVRRLDAGRFVADLALEAGPLEISVAYHTSGGTHLRGVFDFDVPEG